VKDRLGWLQRSQLSGTRAYTAIGVDVLLCISVGMAHVPNLQLRPFNYLQIMTQEVSLPEHDVM
jgi:hypothetical protein